MIDWIFEIVQDRNIRKAQDDAASARIEAQRFRSRTTRQGGEIAKLRKEVAQLALTCQALWEITREQSGLSDEAIEQKIREVDGRDGKVDGRMGKS